MFFFARVQKFKNALTRRKSRLNRSHRVADFGNRSVKLTDVSYQRAKIAQAQLPVDRADSTKNYCRERRKIANKAHHRINQPAKKLRTPRSAIHFGVDFFEFFDRIFFAVIRFDDFVRAHHFFGKTVDFSGRSLKLGEIFLRKFRDQTDQNHRKNRRTERDQANLPTNRNNHRCHADKCY